MVTVTAGFAVPVERMVIVTAELVSYISLLNGGFVSCVYHASVVNNDCSSLCYLLFPAPVLGAAVNLVPAMVRAIGSKLVKQDEEGRNLSRSSVAVLFNVKSLFDVRVITWEIFLLSKIGSLFYMKCNMAKQTFLNAQPKYWTLSYKELYFS